MLRRLASDPDAQFMVDDVHFLRGFSQYLIASERFERLELDSGALGVAKTSFASVSDLDDQLYKISRLYLAASHFLSARYWALGQLTADESVAVNRDSAMTNASKAEGIFNTLAEFGAMANFDYYMSSRYSSVIDKFDLGTGPTLFNRSQLEFSGVDNAHRTLLQAYSHFLNYLSSGDLSGRPEGAGDASESRFWQNLADYLIYLSGDGEQPIDLTSLFTDLQIKDWRADYLTVLHAFYSNESRVLAGSLSPASVDTLFLMPFHRKRAGYLQILGRLQQELDVLNLQSVKELIRSSPGAVAASFQASFGTIDNQKRRDVYGFANYLLTLAEKNQNLYAAAYLAYEFLNRIGYLKEKTTLLKAYCEYRWYGKSEQENQDALSLLSDENISTFSNNHRAEAIYYRAMFYRKIDGPQYSSRVVQEMQRIQDNHPYAGYGLGYERFRTVDVDLMNKVYTQVCKQEDSLEELCDACTNITGYDPEEISAPEVHIGDPDVRFENLTNLRRGFVLAEKKFLVDYWQVFSSPMQIAVPDTNKQLTCNIAGPREFYIGNRIKVNLTLGKPDTLKQVTVSSKAEGCRTLSTTDVTQSLDVYALRSYNIVVATQGQYPARRDIRFTTNEETVRIRYEDALDPSGALLERDGSEIRVDTEDDFFIASRDNSNSLKLYKTSGKAVSNGLANYSALAFVRDRHYVLDRLSNQLWKMNEDGQLSKIDRFDESLLDKPSDLTGFNGHLVIANSGNNT
ncbi:hypothetical protein MJD09_16650, partial [bacterium]|nr:hypothetical protein [bacterium]